MKAQPKILLASLLVGVTLNCLSQTQPKEYMNKIFSYVAIPSIDFERAFKFYHAITDGLIEKNTNAPFPMAYFIDKDYNYVGHLFQLPQMKLADGTVVDLKPSSDGAIIYMEMAKDLNETLEKITKAGGKILMPKTLIGPGKGYWALFLDTEGNKLALHSIQ